MKTVPVMENRDGFEMDLYCEGIVVRQKANVWMPVLAARIF